MGNKNVYENCLGFEYVILLNPQPTYTDDNNNNNNSNNNQFRIAIPSLKYAMQADLHGY